MTSARPLRVIVKWSCSYPWAFGHDVRLTIAKLAARVAASDHGDRGPGRPPAALRPCAIPRRPKPKWPPGPCRITGLTPHPYPRNRVWGWSGEVVALFDVLDEAGVG
ncbi:MAG: hypothetical protein ACLQFR_24550, partial [Streptosporangiaceae bacterium]